MSYANPITITYSFGEHDFGAGGEVLSFLGLKGHYGRVRDVQVNATETFTEVTTNAKVQVGTASDTDKFAILNIGALADTNSINTISDTDAILVEGIPVDTQVELTLVAPTGGTPAGKGFVHVVVDWWK